MITFDIISETILLEGAFQDKGNQKRGEKYRNMRRKRKHEVFIGNKRTSVERMKDFI